MARKKNAAFAGASPFEVDVDALTLKATIENAVGDVALIHDRVTGQNGHSAADTINHTGGGRGSLLGGALWNQWIGRDLGYTGVGSGKDAVPGPIWLCAMPVFIPDGEEGNTFEVEVVADLNFSWYTPVIRLTTSAGVAIDVQALVEVGVGATAGHIIYRATFDAPATQLILVFLEADTSKQGASAGSLYSWSGGFFRIGNPGTASRNTSGSTVGVTTPSATEGVAHVDLEAGLFVLGDAIDGYTVSRLNRNINGLEEYLTGWPAAGNADYVHVDHDGAGVADDADPARSRFHAHTRSLYASEPEIDFVLWAEAFGAFAQDGGAVVDVAASPPTAGMLSWFAPYPLAVALTTIRRLILRYPDFQTSSSRLKWAILVGSDQTADLSNWQVGITGPGTAAASPGAAFAVGGSSTVLALATGTALAFTGDGITTTAVNTERTAGVFDTGRDEIFVLGACLYFEP